MIGALLAPLSRLFEHGRETRAGAAPAPQPAIDEDPAPNIGETRVDRSLGRPQEILYRALAQKVLGGWLQNRNQVLVPLTLRLGSLESGDRELLMRFAAASLLAASEVDHEARLTVTRWLRSIGAIDDAIGVFEQALQAPTALNRLIDGIQARHLGSYAYAIAAITADLRTVSGRLYADFVAARLELPADAVRSINRRFRR